MRRTVFCQVHGISAHRLDYYRRMRRDRANSPPHLLPVELAGPSCPGPLLLASQAGPLRVELGNGRRILVEEGFSATLLQAVVAALEG